MNTAKTIREAVTLAVKHDSDHWACEIETGRLHDAAVKNRISSNGASSSINDFITMSIATRYGGRHNQVNQNDIVDGERLERGLA